MKFPFKVLLLDRSVWVNLFSPTGEGSLLYLFAYQWCHDLDKATVAKSVSWLYLGIVSLLLGSPHKINQPDTTSYTFTSPYCQHRGWISPNEQVFVEQLPRVLSEPKKTQPQVISVVHVVFRTRWERLLSSRLKSTGGECPWTELSQWRMLLLPTAAPGQRSRTKRPCVSSGRPQCCGPQGLQNKQ